jgi:hypothetical protein
MLVNLNKTVKKDEETQWEEANIICWHGLFNWDTTSIYRCILGKCVEKDKYKHVCVYMHSIMTQSQNLNYSFENNVTVNLRHEIYNIKIYMHPDEK